jgi:hypothetical protein
MRRKWATSCRHSDCEFVGVGFDALRIQGKRHITCFRVDLEAFTSIPDVIEEIPNKIATIGLLHTELLLALLIRVVWVGLKLIHVIVDVRNDVKSEGSWGRNIFLKLHVSGLHFRKLVRRTCFCDLENLSNTHFWSTAGLCWHFESVVSHRSGKFGV